MRRVAVGRGVAVAGIAVLVGVFVGRGVDVMVGVFVGVAVDVGVTVGVGVHVAFSPKATSVGVSSGGLKGFNETCGLIKIRR